MIKKIKEQWLLLFKIISNFLSEKRLWKIVMICSIVFFVLVLSSSLFYLKDLRGIKEVIKPSPELVSDGQQEQEVLEVCPDCVRRAIDGVYVPADASAAPLFAVVLDNHFDARPIEGLEKASLVYEAEVEGRFTRYLAVFSGQEEIAEIGPVRSARPYFVDWAQELNALYVHVGGSPQALAEIISKKVFNINEFYNQYYFWRSKQKRAPHNVLTSSELLNKYYNNYSQLQASNFNTWKFKDDQATEATIDAEIIINFKPQDFQVSWVYDQDSNSYLRKQVSDKGTKEIKAKNVIIQYLAATVLDEKLRLEMETVGEGTAIVCLDGVCLDTTWEKESLSKRTRFFSEDGHELEFNAGPTWIEVLRPDIDVIFNKQT